MTKGSFDKVLTPYWRGKEIQKWTQQKQGQRQDEGKSGAEQRLIFRAPGRLLSSVPDGVASQKGHFAEFLPEWLRWLGINKREDFVNVPEFSGVMRPRDPIQITGESIIQNIRNKVSIFLSHVLSGCFFQNSTRLQYCPFCCKRPCQAWA